ncbi:MAG: protein kinase [Simkaniaceae bacterium]|nr:protein kinase [Simkaniaceae bacterium]
MAVTLRPLPELLDEKFKAPITEETAREINASRIDLKARIKRMTGETELTLEYCKAVQSLFKKRGEKPCYFLQLPKELQESAKAILTKWSSNSIHHRLDRTLGKGASACVVAKTGNLALKVLQFEDADKRKLWAKFEFRTLHSVPSHPGIIHPICRLKSSIYFPKLPKGYNAFIPSEFPSPLTGEQWMSAISQILLAIDHMNSHGIKHNDLGPSNVRISPKPDVKIIDFGLSTGLEEKKAGSPFLTAKEMFFPKTSDETYTKSDVFSAGLLILLGISVDAFFYIAKNFHNLGGAIDEIFATKGVAETIACSAILEILEKYLPSQEMELAQKLCPLEDEFDQDTILFSMMQLFYTQIDQAYIDAQIDTVLMNQFAIMPGETRERVRAGLQAALKLGTHERKTAAEVHAIIFPDLPPLGPGGK